MLQLPPLQLALSANLSLCLSVGGSDGVSLLLDACAPAGAAPLTQLFYFARTFADGVLLSGPLYSAVGGLVVDILSLSDDIGTSVRISGNERGSNQLFMHPWPAMRGIIRAPQMGVCLGACYNP